MNQIPSVESPPYEQFYFDVVDKEIEEKDRIISDLKEELNELREFVLHQRQQTIARKRVLKELTNIVEDIVALYPSFIDNDEHTAQLALVKGYEYANDMVSHIDKFNSGERVLQFIQTELKEIQLETATYKPVAGSGSSLLIHCKTVSSMDGFKPSDVNNPHVYLHSAMNNMIVEPIRLGHCKRNASGPASVWYPLDNKGRDGIFYKSNEEHAQIWEWKKIFSKRMIASLLTYVENLLQQV